MSDRELVAQEIVKRLFVDLRDRKLLKWFFPTADEYDPDFFIGDITVKPITPEVQEEIAAAWRQIVLAPIIAADAERRVRDAVLEEARLKAGAHSCAKYGDHDAQLLAQRVSIDIADAIGALKKDDKCSTP